MKNIQTWIESLEHIVFLERVEVNRLDLLDLLKQLQDAHKLLDLRDEEYFKWCETGVMPQSAADRKEKE